MITCKFFLQGTCKFGDGCRYSHQINDMSQIHGSSIMRQNSKPSTIDTNLLIKSVATDMINAEKGGLWLLSSYTPFKDKPFFPGFENQSFEEVRYGYYEANKNGTIEQYKQQLHIALQVAAIKMRALQNPTSEIISMLIQIYNTPVDNQNNTTFTSPQPSLAFQQNQPQSGSIFAMANQQLFGKSSNQQPSIFGGTAISGSNIFNSVAQQNTNQNIFTNNQPIFNNQQGFSSPSNNSIFGNQNFLASSGAGDQNRPFAAQSSSFPTQNNVFGQANTNIFQTSISNSPFGNKEQSANKPIFLQDQPYSNTNPVSQNMLSSPFSGQTQQSIYAVKPGHNTQLGLSPMEQPQESNQMSSTANSILRIPTPNANTNMFTQQTSIFNNHSTDQKLSNSVFAQPQSGSEFSGNTETIDSNAYSKLEDLNESDIKCFESESFEFGKIPEKPPTAQMCN